MPTLEHNAIVAMFRERPSLAPDLLARLLHVEVPPHASVGVVEASLDQLLPVEFRADLVLDLRDAEGAVVLSVILEVQRDQDPHKLYSWPAYLALVRAKQRCPAIVLVVAPDPAVASWAAQPIDLGGGLAIVRTVVLGPPSLPAITDPAAAEQDLELAVLSAVAHGNGPNGLAVVLAATLAMGRLDREHAAVYFQIIWSALREPMQRALEARVMEKQVAERTKFPPFIEKLIDDGLLEGERVGRAKGELEGRAKGELEGKRDTLLRLAARVGVPLGEDDRARILTCAEVATLDRWIDNVLGATRASDLFA